jgi:PAS domain S-box-containing protein
VDFGLLESVPDAMVIADAKGTILHLNGHAERLFGWPRAEVVGRPVEVLLPARFRAMHEVHRAGYHTAPRTREMGLGLDLAGLRADGREFPAEISLSPIDVDGVPCVIAAVRDVTERRAVEERARLWRKAQEEVRERDEFLSIASHELRTPVTALMLQLELLHRQLQKQASELPGLVEGRLTGLERQAKRISLLVNELLDVSRIRLGMLELRYEDADLAEVARETARSLEGELARSGSHLELALAPAPGRFDRLRVEQVVSNLLVNAAKFGQGKPVRLEVGPAGDRARLRVVDSGIGIGAADQPRVFERFERAVEARHFGGFGLGLYVARQIVEAHGGTIAVESTPGSGAAFTVEIPTRAPASVGASSKRRQGLS